MTKILSDKYELKTLNVQGAELSATIYLPDNLSYFDGHFDEVSILPGVVQVHWVIDLAYEHLGIKDEFSEISQLKFMQVIKPNSSIDIKLQYEEEKNQLAFSFSSEKGKNSSGKIKFAQAQGGAHGDS